MEQFHRIHQSQSLNERTRTDQISPGKMLRKLLLLCCAISTVFASLAGPSNDTELATTTTERILSRKRRYLVFPEGSSFSCAVCMTVGLIGNPNYQLFSWSLNWGVAYDLPNNVTLFTGVGRDPENAVMDEEPAPAAKRRFRRDLYERLELLIDSMGHNGKSCIQRALCESRQYFKGPGATMVEEMVRTVFSLPKIRVFSFENQGIVPFDKAHRSGRSVETNCKSLYEACRFSLLDLALGRYGSPPKGYQFM